MAPNPGAPDRSGREATSGRCARRFAARYGHGALLVIRLRFVRSKGFVSDAIALHEKTCMPFTPSHVECVTPDGKWLGQHIDGGMLARPAGYDHDDVAIMADSRRCEIFVSI